MKFFRNIEDGRVEYFVKGELVSVLVDGKSCKFYKTMNSSSFDRFEVGLSDLIFNENLRKEVDECLGLIIKESKEELYEERLVEWFLSYFPNFIIELENFKSQLKKIEESEL